VIATGTGRVGKSPPELAALAADKDHHKFNRFGSARFSTPEYTNRDVSAARLRSKSPYPKLHPASKTKAILTPPSYLPATLQMRSI